LPDSLSVGEDCCKSRDGCPFAGAVEEGDIDVRVRLDIVGLARLSVGVEDQVNTAVFL
jgi:hypothetical protein